MNRVIPAPRCIGRTQFFLRGSAGSRPKDCRDDDLLFSSKIVLDSPPPPSYDSNQGRVARMTFPLSFRKESKAGYHPGKEGARECNSRTSRKICPH